MTRRVLIDLHSESSTSNLRGANFSDNSNARIKAAEESVDETETSIVNSSSTRSGRGKKIGISSSIEKSDNWLSVDKVFKNNSEEFNKHIKENIGFAPNDRKRQVAEALDRAQDQYHRHNNLFKHVIVNDINGVKHHLKYSINASREIEDTIDPCGANIIHIAYLFQYYELGRWLVETYPEQAFLPYSNDPPRLPNSKDSGKIETEHYDNKSVNKHVKGACGIEIKPEEMPYTGENILHVLIVQKNIVEIRWLLEFYKNHTHSVAYGLEVLLKACVSGAFFAEDGGFYCGSYPLHFAVGSGSTELFDLVFAYFSSVTTESTHSHSSSTSHSEKVSSTSDDILPSKKSSKIQISSENRIRGKAFEYRLKILKNCDHKLGNNAIFMRDRYGNNCLHICAIHQLEHMYQHIKSKAENILRTEIKLAYGKFTESKRSSNENILIKTLPVWNVLSKKSLCGMKSRPNWIDDLELVLERYVPFYNMFSIARLNKITDDRSVEEENLDNGFYFGYSQRETPIKPPPDYTHHAPVPQVALTQWLNKMVWLKLGQRFEWVLNEKFHSPLTLALIAAETKTRRGVSESEQDRTSNFMHYIVRQQNTMIRWQFGPVTSTLLYLEGVDMRFHRSRYGDAVDGDKSFVPSKPLPYYAKAQMFGLIEWICVKNYQQAVSITEVKSIIESKWQNQGFPLFARYQLHWTMLCLITTVVVCYSNETFTFTPSNVTDVMVTVFYFISFLFFTAIALLELPAMLRFGFDYWGFSGNYIRGAARFSKQLTTATVILFFTLISYKYQQLRYMSSSAFHPTDDQDFRNQSWYTGMKTCEVWLIITVWMHQFYFLMGWDFTGPFVLTVANIVGRDIPYFLMFYLIVLISFSAALGTLTMDYNTSTDFGINTLLNGIYDLAKITIQQGLPSNSSLDISNVPPDLHNLFNLLLSSFYLVSLLMFVNLLIGMIGNTFSLYSESKDELLLIAKYDIMCSQDLTLWLLADKRNRLLSYAIERDVTETAAAPNDHLHTPRHENIYPDSSDLLHLRDETNRFHHDEAVRYTLSNNANKAKLSSGGKVIKKEKPVYAIEIISENSDWWSIAADGRDVGVDSSNNNIKPANQSITLLILDPQNDFHEAYGTRPQGSLAVPGALSDSQRIAEMISNNIDKIHDIIVTLDSHHPIHIAHACFWKRGRMQSTLSRASKGSSDANACDNIHPSPFTKITHQDVLTGMWEPVIEVTEHGTSMMEWCKYYTKELENKKKMVLTIWPMHCIIGTNGHAVVDVLSIPLQKWEQRHSKSVEYITKGSNMKTEMYSALQADVEDPCDPDTGFNEQLMSKLQLSDKVLVCGQARSHVVKYTMEDIVKSWSGSMSKLYLLEDGCSSVSGYERVGQEFLQDMRSQKVNVVTCLEVFPACVQKAAAEERRRSQLDKHSLVASATTIATATSNDAFSITAAAAAAAAALDESDIVNQLIAKTESICEELAKLKQQMLRSRNISQ